MLLALALLLNTAQAAEPSWVAMHQLPRHDGLYTRWDPERSWGASVMVHTLTEVAERLAFLLPDAEPLVVGDISRRGGGHFNGHKTHHLGIDVDIGLYLKGGRQRLEGFHELSPDQIDLHANWVLIRALLNTGHVSFILLDRTHIEALRSYLLEDLEMPRDVVEPIFPEHPVPWSQRGVVRHAPNHAGHLHVRITSPPQGS